MRIAVEHRTHYRFSEPQARIIQVLRLRPGDTTHQTVVSWQIDVACDARLREAQDGYGNAVTMLYADGPIDALEITVTGEVLTTDAAGLVQSPHEPMPPIFYLRSTPRSVAGAPLEQFAAAAAEGASDPLDGLHRLNTALRDRFVIAHAHDRGESADEAFARAHGSPRDLAHMFAGVARARAVPARHVTGYRRNGGESCLPHSWVEAWFDGLGWVAFDPSAGICADERYVRVAVGLDANDTAPIQGHRIGQGEEALDIDLIVERLGGEE